MQDNGPVVLHQKVTNAKHGKTCNLRLSFSQHFQDLFVLFMWSGYDTWKTQVSLTPNNQDRLLPPAETAKAVAVSPRSCKRRPDKNWETLEVPKYIQFCPAYHKNIHIYPYTSVCRNPWYRHLKMIFNRLFNQKADEFGPVHLPRHTTQNNYNNGNDHNVSLCIIFYNTFPDIDLGAKKPPLTTF